MALFIIYKSSWKTCFHSPRWLFIKIYLLLLERCKPSLQSSFSVMFASSTKSQFGVLLHILQIEILKSLISSSGSLFVIVNLDKNIFLTPYFQHFRNCVLYFVGYCLLGRYHLSSLEDCLYQGFGRDFSLSNPCLNLTV